MIAITHTCESVFAYRTNTLLKNQHAVQLLLLSDSLTWRQVRYNCMGPLASVVEV